MDPRAVGTHRPSNGSLPTAGVDPDGIVFIPRTLPVLKDSNRI